MGNRLHRNQAAYPHLWQAIEGAVRDAMMCHDDIQIPGKRVASIVKRAVGQVLALHGVGVGKPTEMGDDAVGIVLPIGANLGGVEGDGQLQPSPACRRCGGELRPGIATGQTFTRPAPDFGDDVPEVGTVSYGGPGRVIPVLKCGSCGWSVG